MPFYFTPITIAFVLIALLLVITAVPPVVRALRHRLFLRKRFTLFEVPNSLFKDLKLADFFKKIPVPFVFEIAVHNLGKEIHYYLAVPMASIRSVVLIFNLRETSEYNIFHSGGSHLGFYLKNDIEHTPDLSTIDFSAVNEVGEGVVVQFIVIAKGIKKLANFRVLISAPTPYQAQEIAFGINSSLSGFKPVAASKNPAEFINKVTFREFDEDESRAFGK